MDHHIIKAKERLTPADYKTLLAQARQLSDMESMADATQWLIADGNIRAMVKDEAGIRFIA